MRKISVLLAIVLAFDLGAVVAASHAADDGHVKTSATQSAGFKADLQPVFVSSMQAVDKTGAKTGTTVQGSSGCTAAGGKIEIHSWSWGASQAACVMPGGKGPNAISDQASSGTLTSYKK